MGKRGKWKDDALQWTAVGEFDPELTALSRNSDEQTQYVAPGAEKKWRARDLVDIHWKIFAIECPASFNRIMSCIIGHANPSTGRCQLKRKLIAVETGYSIATVKRAIKWWVSKKFLVVESTGVGRSNAYHPQWELFELHWIAAADDIEAQKGAWRHEALQSDVGHQGDPRAGHQGDPRGGQYGDPHESQIRTLKKESHPERVRPPSVADTHVIISSEGKKEEGIQRGMVESASTNSQPPEGPISFEAAEQVVMSVMGDFEWRHLTQEIYRAAIQSEMEARGAGVAAVKAASMEAWRSKRKGKPK